MMDKKSYGFLSTPPLWTKEQFGIRQFEFPTIATDTFRQKPIPTNRRLGHQMEYVFQQLLEHDPSYAVILNNLPIKNEKRTLGEIDFILRDLKTEKLLHVELTYKFYIIDPDISEPIHRLMGPNRRDMFFTKMEKIKNEQFPILHSEEGVAALRARDIDVKSIIHQACFKAQLFYPYNAPKTSIRPLNKACIVGYWLHFDTINGIPFKQCLFYIPFKTEWPIVPHMAVPWISHFELLMELQLRMLKENAPLIWIKKEDDTIEKCFVVWW